MREGEALALIVRYLDDVRSTVWVQLRHVLQQRGAPSVMPGDER